MSNVKYDCIREHRPDTYNDYGEQSAVVKEEFEKKCMKRADRSFAQGLQCQQINSINALMSMDDSVFVVHSPQGCVGCANLGIIQYRIGQAHRGITKIKTPRVIVTNIDQKDVILGGEKKLREAVAKAIKRYDPKMIFVFTSCASGIIGDDIDSILYDIQQSTEAKLVPIHCEGFKSKICASGYDAALNAVCEYLMPEKAPDKQDNLINLFSPGSISYKDQVEMTRMLEQIGLEVNYFPFYSSYDKIQRIASAAASTSICKVFADEFMKELEEKYQIPYSHTVMPIGIRNTDIWYRGVAKLFGKEDEVEAIIQREHERVYPQIEHIKKKLQGKRVFICGGTGRSFAAAALIEDYGMQLVGIETPTYDADAQVDIEYLNSIHKDFYVDVANMQPFEQANLLQTLKPDVFIGVPTWASKLGYPTTHVLDMKRPTMGYDGILYLGEKISEELSNPGFNKKLAAHVKLPYKQSWYEEDAFKYIKRRGE